MDLVIEVLKIGNNNCISDAAVAGEMAYAAAYGAYYNVQINLLDLKEDQKYCKMMHSKSDAVIKQVDQKIIKIKKIAEKILKNE